MIQNTARAPRRGRTRSTVILKAIIYATLTSNLVISLAQAQIKWPDHPTRRNEQSIYVNPNPSNKSSGGPSYKPIVAFSHNSNPQVAASRLNGRAVGAQTGPTPSSIGKNERNQVAEWPFFKSLQNVRNNQNADRYFDLLVDAKKSMDQKMSAKLQERQQQGRPSTSRSDNTADLDRMAFSSSTIADQSAAQETSTAPSVATSTTTTTTTTSTPASSESTMMGTDQPETEEANTASQGGGDMSEVEEVVTMSVTQMPTTTSSTSTTTTTEAPSSTTAASVSKSAPRPPEMSSEPKMVPMMADPTPLFAPVIHSSIQQAVDRIVSKMAQQNQRDLTPKVESESPSGPHTSLNVLLKHFGLHNLTQFDHLLLSQRQKPANRDQANKLVDDPDTIHLELKPFRGADCLNDKGNQTGHNTAQGSRQNMDAMPSGAAQPIDEMKSMMEPSKEERVMSYINYATNSSANSLHAAPAEPGTPTGGQENQPVGGRSVPAADRVRPINSVANQQRRKFVLKMPHEKELHPLNNRFKVSQSFDVPSSPAATRSSPTHTASSPPRAEGRSTNHEDQICDGQQHYTTVGQLTSPDYPRYYPANIHCSFVIKRASMNHCRLLLQFRDFDLINANQGNASQSDPQSRESSVCASDYLQIGETRYCNRYAMIGHKMKLDFSTSGLGHNAMIRLTFHSDHMRSGRGFLIKYQQIPCDSEADNGRTASNSRRASSGAASATSTDQPTGRHTLAPPLQQPDFSLALRTNSAGSSTTARPQVAQLDQIGGRSQQQASEKQTSSTTGAHSMTSMASTTRLSDTMMAEDHLETRATSARPEFAQQTAISDCGQVNDEMNFILRSPNWPESYGNNLDCLYYIRRNNSRVCYVELTFIKFDIEADADCRYDYLEVNNVRLCGSLKDLAHKTTRIYLFNEALKVIKFKSDSIGAKSGFLIRADQLECASNGSIIRRPKLFDQETASRGRNEAISDVLQAVLTGPQSSGPSYELKSTSANFQYDSPPTQRQPTIEPSSSLTNFPQSSSSRLASEEPYVCNDVLYGREVTIKSPHWPESYASDESISTCKYTIIRSTIGRNKICQLELRFINLRLSPSDCIDINGYELLCGFNTRNLVKYYPFSERQSHITVTFLSSGSFATAKTGRSFQNHSDLLPMKLAPLRFMIIARQHECVDGFLSPHSESSSGYNHTSLLYSNGPRFVNRTITPASKSSDSTAPQVNSHAKSSAGDSTLMYSFPDYASNSSQAANSTSRATEFATSAVCPDGSLRFTNDQLFTRNYPVNYPANAHCYIIISRQSPSICHLELELFDIDLDSSGPSDICDSDYVQFNFGERYCNMEQVGRRLGPKRLLVLPFSRANEHKATILFHSNSFRSARGLLLRHRQVDCVELLQRPVISDVANVAEKKLIGRVPLVSPPSSSPSAASLDSATAAPTSDLYRKCLIQFSQYNGILSSFNILSNMRANFSPLISECEIKFKLLPGFCQLQLVFSKFDLNPRIGASFCLEYLELDGIQYCGQELKNTTRVLPMSEPRAVSLKFFSSNSSNFYSFRAVSKQIECDPEPLKPIGQLNTRPAQSDRQAEPIDSGSRQQAASPVVPNTMTQQVDFRDVPIGSEFFELNSAKISKSVSSYDANMFIVYRIKKVRTEVCKLRLMFYRFELETSPHCKRDFLDIDNVDRLCGALAKPEDTRRDYDWSGDRDFLVSFVSDSNIQREGYLLFGQQLSSCGNNNQTSATTMATPTMTSAPIMGATFDEEPMNDRPLESIRKQAAKNNEQATGSEPFETNCSSVHYETSFELASPDWPQRYKSKVACYYLIHKSQPDVCSVTFNVVSMILDPDERDPIRCDISGSDHLDIDGQILCGLISRPRQVTVEYSKRQFITAKFNSIAATGFGFFIEAKQNKCPDARGESEATTGRESTGERQGSESQVPKSPQRIEKVPVDSRVKTGPDMMAGCNQLLVGDINVVESNNFPTPHENNLDCLYAIRRTNQSVCAIDITMNYFELEDPNPATGMCENDYLEIDYSRFCGTYPANHQLRFNYFDQELDKLIKFRSDATNARAGFSLTISQVMNGCRGDEQAGERQQQQVIGAGKSSPEGSSKASDELISYLPDSSTSTASRQPTLSDSADTLVANNMTSKTSEVSSTLCQFVYHAERQYLLSPNYNTKRRTYDNNIDCMYKILAKSYDYCALRLTLLDIDLESSMDCHNDYVLIDNQRYCGSSPSGGPLTSLRLEFSENPPREIHLLYHTNGHLNMGRGFRILYEQVPCESRNSSNPSSNASERAARRSNFGQVSYPKNYVSAFESQEGHHATATQPQHRTKDSWNSNGPKLPAVRPTRADTSDLLEATGEAQEVHSSDLVTINKNIVVGKPSRLT